MTTRKLLLVLGFIWVIFLTALYAFGDAQAQDAAHTAATWSSLVIVLIWLFA